jgi:hypothetical protein
LLFISGKKVVPICDAIDKILCFFCEQPIRKDESGVFLNSLHDHIRQGIYFPDAQVPEELRFNRQIRQESDDI